MTQTGGRLRRSWGTTILWAIGILVVLFIAIQFVPYGRDHSTPPATHLFAWSDPQAQTIAERSCYDCHSNQTKWWWATKLAPVSWLVRHDVDGAREIINFSEWNGGLSAAELSNAISDNMPSLQYTLIHSGAKLSDADKQTLAAGSQASLGANASGSASVADATAIIDARCGACHSTAQAQQFRTASAAEAQGLTDQMIQQGATVTPAEEQALIGYFTR
jgi:hypothetical protein